MFVWVYEQNNNTCIRKTYNLNTFFKIAKIKAVYKT